MTRGPKRVLGARSQRCSRLRARLTEQRSITDAIAPTWLSFPAGGVSVPGCRPGRAAVLHPTPVAADTRHARRAGAGQAASEGQLSSAPQLARTLEALAETVGPAHAVIAHSLGAVVTTLAMEWGVPVSRAAFLAPNAEPIAHTLRWAQRLGLRPDVVARMRAATERRIAFSWDDLDVVAMARRRTTPLLVIHDAMDDVVPWMEGAAIVGAWPGRRFVTTRGLGHSPLVRSPEVVAQVVEFLGTPERSLARPSARIPGVGHELFYREWRPSLPSLSA